MSDNPKGERCEFMQYHQPHDYRNVHGNPRRCEGLLPPKDAHLTQIAEEVAAIRKLLSATYGVTYTGTVDPERAARAARLANRP